MSLIPSRRLFLSRKFIAQSESTGHANARTAPLGCNCPVSRILLGSYSLGAPTAKHPQPPQARNPGHYLVSTSRHAPNGTVILCFGTFRLHFILMPTAKFSQRFHQCPCGAGGDSYYVTTQAPLRALVAQWWGVWKTLGQSRVGANILDYFSENQAGPAGQRQL